MKNKKWIWIGTGAACVLMISLALVLLVTPNKKEAVSAPVQQTTKVVKGSIMVSVSGSGSVISTNSESVRTKDEGKVKEVLVKAGDIVKKGQALLTFEGEDLSDSLESKQSSLESQKMDLLDIQAQYKKQVYEGASEEELNNTRKSISKQELEIKNTESEIASLKEDMVPPASLSAPMDGTVTSVNITAGEKANNGSELFVIHDYQNLSVKIQVDELDIPQVKTGMQASVQLDALPDTSINGVVSDIADEGTSSNGVSLFDVTIKLDQTDGVRVGMSAEASIVLSDKKDILTLPVEAVQKRGDGYVVMLPFTASDSAGDNRQSGVRGPEGGEASKSAPKTEPAEGTGQRNQVTARGKAQQVEIGVHNETLIEIVSGLNEGDEVVIPTVIGTSTNRQQEQTMQGEGGFGGFGGGTMPGGGGIPGGGMSGGGGGVPSGGGGMSGGGFNRGGGGR
ncbi:efflux RND transporter periplasmic adaptor subunit [Paenibacillus sp. DYY-L-2]|uniref:efflux RND transporter periplasmic adaptor subunit n=1 Tax=Paenibacillus sp. DYY-L-2 TaxID=3447013 RepID=UPI003F50B095